MRLFLVSVVLCLSFISQAQLFKKYVTDVDGNIYNVVKIGKQYWFSENLKTTKFNDSTDIQIVTNNQIWFSNYLNNTNIPMMYDSYYNGFVVNNEKNVCPKGWRVADKKDFEILTEYVKRGTLKGDKWVNKHDLSINYNNDYNFSATPEGYRSYNGNFLDRGFHAYWWSSTKIEGELWKYCLYQLTHMGVISFSNMYYGYNVRCIKE